MKNLTTKVLRLPNTKPKPAPRGLSPEAQSWWRRIQSEYDITDEAGLFLLQTALEAFMRMRLAQDCIQKEGMTIRDKFGQLKPHPLIAAERDARSGMLQSLKNLNLDLEPLRDRMGRPSGS